jgi:hypothetical protein
MSLPARKKSCSRHLHDYGHGRRYAGAGGISDNHQSLPEIQTHKRCAKPPGKGAVIPAAWQGQKEAKVRKTAGRSVQASPCRLLSAKKFVSVDCCCSIFNYVIPSVPILKQCGRLNAWHRQAAFASAFFLCAEHGSVFLFFRNSSWTPFLCGSLQQPCFQYNRVRRGNQPTLRRVHGCTFARPCGKIKS